MGDYFGFEDVMRELELGEEELKRMVSEGELRAFRDENKMKFKKEDVENLKKGRITEPTIILPSTPATDKIDETLLDLDISEETAALASSSGEPLVQFDELSAGSHDTDLSPFETDEDLLVTEPSGSEIGSDTTETFIEEDADTGLSTEPIHLAEDDTIEADAIMEDTGETEEFVGPTTRSGRRSTRGRRATAQVPMAVESEVESRRASPVWTAVLFLTVLLGAVSTVFYYDTLRMESGQADRPLGLTTGASTWVLEKFWSDPEWKKFHERDYPNGGKTQPPFKDDSGNLRLNFDEAVYRGPSFELPDTPPRPAP